MMVLAALAATLAPEMEAARVRISVGVGHPIRRPLPNVVVRQPRKTVVVAPRTTYLAPVVWTGAVVALPARDRLVWEDSERIERNEDWVDSHFGVDARGNALYLQLQGRAQLNFAEVTFGNGSAQVVDFNESVRTPGIYKLLDFADGREVKQVRIVARARTPQAKLTVYIAK
jgi:hypothetical protein